jgi:hypothetical protein
MYIRERKHQHQQVIMRIKIIPQLQTIQHNTYIYNRYVIRTAKQASERVWWMES